MVGMACLPVGKNHHARAQKPEHAHDLQAVFKGVLDVAVGQIEGPPPAHTQNPRRLAGFAGAVFCGAARPGFAAREIQDRSAQSARRHAQQSAAAGLFHIVAMSGDGQDIGGEGIVQLKRASFRRTELKGPSSPAPRTPVV